MSEIKEDIFCELMSGERTVERLAAIVDCSESEVIEALSEIVKDNEAEKTESGNWKLTV